MRSTKLLAELYRRGAKVWVDGKQLAVEATAPINDLRPAIKEHKAALIALLTTTPAPREVVRFDAGAAYREFAATPAEVREFLRQPAPAQLEHSGLDIVPPGVWVTGDGFVNPTPATLVTAKQRIAAK